MDNLNEFLTDDDLQVLTSTLMCRQAQLKASGDYPEKTRDAEVLNRLLYTRYYTSKGGKLTVGYKTKEKVNGK